MTFKNNDKKPDKPGRLKQLMDALKDRYHRVVEVIDEALDSENLRDKIWAVDQLFKRLKVDLSAEPKEAATKKILDEKTIKKMTDDELMDSIQQLLTPEQNKKQ